MRGSRGTSFPDVGDDRADEDLLRVVVWLVHAVSCGRNRGRSLLRDMPAVLRLEPGTYFVVMVLRVSSCIVAVPTSSGDRVHPDHSSRSGTDGPCCSRRPASSLCLPCLRRRLGPAPGSPRYSVNPAVTRADLRAAREGRRSKRSHWTHPVRLRFRLTAHPHRALVRPDRGGRLGARRRDSSFCTFVHLHPRSRGCASVDAQSCALNRHRFQ